MAWETHECFVKKMWQNLKLAPAVHIYNPKRLSLGDNVYIGYNSYIGDGDITFDDEVVLGPFCSVTGGNHLYRDVFVSVAMSTNQSTLVRHLVGLSCLRVGRRYHRQWLFGGLRRRRYERCARWHDR